MNWLDELKPGDPVILRTDYFARDGVLATVDRTTATLVIVGKNRYRKADGYAPGDSLYSRARILPATPENVLAAQRATLRRRLESMQWATVSDDLLFAVGALVFSVTGTEP